MDGAGPIEFAISTPGADIKAHIRHALSLGLPEADSVEKSLSLVANGPSARSIDLPKGDTMAVNGALKLFTDQGKAPTYWICCDPQGTGDNLVTPIDFLSGPLPESTTYLVASKCHPEIFDRLKGLDVWLWHVNDQEIPNVRRVPCAVSVTICALMLAQRLGYRHIDTYGWDLCFDGDLHHAGDGTLSNTPDRRWVEVGDPPNTEWWESNPTWCAEIKDASGVLPVLRWCGTDVKIHGRSMLAAILPEYAAA